MPAKHFRAPFSSSQNIEKKRGKNRWKPNTTAEIYINAQQICINFYAFRISIWRMRFGHKWQKNNNKFRRIAFHIPHKSGNCGGGNGYGSFSAAALFGDMFSCGFPQRFFNARKKLCCNLGFTSPPPCEKCFFVELQVDMLWFHCLWKLNYAVVAQLFEKNMKIV